MKKLCEILAPKNIGKVFLDQVRNKTLIDITKGNGFRAGNFATSKNVIVKEFSVPTLEHL